MPIANRRLFTTVSRVLSSTAVINMFISPMLWATCLSASRLIFLCRPGQYYWYYLSPDLAPLSVALSSSLDYSWHPMYTC
ncbi:hypothetical protein BDR05DRAFT_969636 [Suillus weaverae]|nr:hypothetical protein BDR05DRAFT_969636 [Suillus weaverae]